MMVSDSLFHIRHSVLSSQEQQDRCIHLLKTAENMASRGHYAGLEARSRAYSVLEAATALHETCDTRSALLQQAILFFKLAQTVSVVLLFLFFPYFPLLLISR